MRVPSLGPRGEGWVVLQFLAMAGVVAASVVPPQWPEDAERPLSLAGLALAVAGAFVVLWAGFALRHELTPVPMPRRRADVVEGGPFRWVRHPMYAGGLLFFVGVSLLASVLSLALTVVLGAVWALKATDEERRLAERFPQYDDYRRRVRFRLVPGIY
jgi:protein-S-isoprenylcysteine O-methyltransferase Ste14